MKRVGKIICILIIAVLIAIMIISNNASAENCNVKLSASDTVTAGNAITVSMTLSEATTMLNGTLSYEPEKFTFNGASTNAQQGGGQFSWNENGNNIAFIFLGQSTTEGGQDYTLTNITFSFTANTGIEEQTNGNFNLLELDVIASEQHTLEQMKDNDSIISKSISITPKSETGDPPLPTDPTDPTDPTNPTNPTSGGTNGNVSKNPSNGVVTNGGNSSSTTNEAVPATGESSVGTITVLIIVTLLVASVVFRRKSRIR